MIVVVIACMMFGSLLSPPLLLLLGIGWLLGLQLTLLVPVGVWLVATLWLSANAGVRHKKHQRFLDALTEAPVEVLDQICRLFGIRRKGLRAV